MNASDFEEQTGIPSFKDERWGASPPDCSNAKGFALDAVTEIVWQGMVSDEGYADGTWCVVVQTGDGWLWVIDAWCDTTGWGCQDATVVRGPFRPEVALHPVTLDGRCRRATWEDYRKACRRFMLDDPGPDADAEEAV